ncbi:MAG: hypothetical protein K2I88_00300 [Anaeroplasmataceae bacterium]|nr:hypothetical protein [Anaeroplasmataceae bacterium]
MLKSTLKGVFVVVIVLVCLILTGCSKTGGELYSLEEAYNKNLLSREDLLNVAYYYNKENGVENSDFTPKTLDPEVLSSKMENEARKAQKKYLEQSYKNVTLEDVKVVGYYGTYNNCVVVLFNSSSCITSDILFLEEYTIEDVKFFNFTYLLKVYYKE